MKQIVFDVAFVVGVVVLGPPAYLWGRFLEWRDLGGS